MDWIDISTETPPTNTRVIVAIKSNADERVFEALHTGSTFTITSKQNRLLYFEDIEAWMPLPNPPSSK